MQRITYFDQMKGIAILLVVIGHVVQFSYGIQDSSVVSMLAIFHMPLFFYVSGYFSYKPQTSWSDCMKRLGRRARTLLVPYFVFGAIGCLLAGGGFTEWMKHPMEVNWFLYVLFIISAFFLLYEQLTKRVKSVYAEVALWLLPYVGLIAIKMYGMEALGGGNNYLCVNQLVTYYRYFLIGYMCRKYVKFNNLLFHNDLVYALGFVAYFAQWWLFDHHNMLLIFAGGLGAIIVIQRILMNSNENSKLSRDFTRLGALSLSIYVIHGFLIPDVASQLGDFLAVEHPFMWVLTFSVLLSLPITIVSAFIGWLIEQNKYLNLVFFGKK